MRNSECGMRKKINELKNLRVQLFDCGLQILDFGFYKIETKKKKINYMYLFFLLPYSEFVGP